MAAELSTGLLAMAAVKDFEKPISLLVLDLKATFEKKAIGSIYFVCNDGQRIYKAVKQAVEQEEAQQVTAYTIGKNEQGEEVCSFQFTWTFKYKNSKN